MALSRNIFQGFDPMDGHSDPTENGDFDPTQLRFPGQGRDLDPLFYRGKSSVLGEPVELRTSGTLPGTFPSAGGPPPTAPGAPSGTPGPKFPDFSFEWSGGEFPEAPLPPTAPNVDILGPGGGQPSWWQKAMTAVEGIDQVRGTLGKFDRLGADLSGATKGPLDASDFNILSPSGEFNPWWQPPGSGHAPPFSVMGPEGGDVLNPADFNLGLSPDQAAQINPANLLGSGIQSAGGIYGAITQPPGSPQMVASSANAVGGLAALGASAGLLPASLAPLGPAAAAVGLPLLLGPPIASMIQGDKARWPKGYQFIPGSSKSGGAGALAIDPATGAVLRYKGDGHYEWHEMTRQGQLPTPDQLRKYQITPMGELAKREGYTGLGKEFRDARLSQNALAPGSGGASPDDIRSAAEERRAPAIAALRARFPNASEAQLWAIYTSSPEYIQEQQWLAQFANPQSAPDR